jgi:hypothetical protein
VADAHAHVQRLVSVVEMATVLEGVLPKSSVLLCVFCWQKDSMQRIFINKCFLFTVGSVCHVKGFVHNWIEKFTRGRSKIADNARPGRPVENATKVTVQRVAELIRADRSNSVTTALGCSHGLA